MSSEPGIDNRCNRTQSYDYDTIHSCTSQSVYGTPLCCEEKYHENSVIFPHCVQFPTQVRPTFARLSIKKKRRQRIMPYILSYSRLRDAHVVCNVINPSDNNVVYHVVIKSKTGKCHKKVVCGFAALVSVVECRNYVM